MSRRDRLSGIDPLSFGGDQGSGELTPQQAADALFGGKLAEIDAGRETIKPISIDQIIPDPSQPRRALPSTVRETWKTVQSDKVGDIFGTWLEMIAQEFAAQKISRQINLDVLLGAGSESQRPEQPTPLEAPFLELVDLAASIRRDGLTNPITVARFGRFYRLETGERRWMAYHLLLNYFDGQEGRADESGRWARIPARVVDHVSVWRQATENTARANLNAIERARQFALLLMDLLGADNFAPIEQFQHERDFYAQVADGKRWRIPRGSAELLLNAMGLKNESQLRYYRALLRLPVSVWTKADDYNTSVRTLRMIIQDSEGDEAKMLKQIERARLKDLKESVSMDTVSEDFDEYPNARQHPPTLSTEDQAGGEKPLLDARDKQHISRAVRLLSGVGRSGLDKLSASEKRHALELAQHMRRIADEIERALKG
jgi:hypothetical protein